MCTVQGSCVCVCVCVCWAVKFYAQTPQATYAATTHITEKQKSDTHYHHLTRPETSEESRGEAEQYSVLEVEQDDLKYDSLQRGPRGTSAQPRLKKLKQEVFNICSLAIEL